MNNKVTNKLKLIIFTACIGACAAIVFWLFMLIFKKGTDFVWEIMPETIGNHIWYPIVICTGIGLLLGVIKSYYGPYPESMNIVFGKLKEQGTYDYSKIGVILAAALLPLICGASVGPEAAMVGIITSLCCWAGENIRFAGYNSKEFSKIGSAVTLSVLFCSPLFGFFEVEEGEKETGTIDKHTKVLMYVVAIGSGVGAYKVLTDLFGLASEGLPQFQASLPEGIDYALMFLYILCGVILGLIFEVLEKGCSKLSKKINPVLGGALAGFILAVVSIFVPAVKFSGEEEMGVLIDQYAIYTPIALIGFALLKVLITNICIEFGLKGGHFFPLIFSAVCLGYGLSLIFFPGNEAHAVFAAAITTAATLGITIRKPIAVTALLFLCFPIRMCFWLFFAAGIATFVSGLIHREDEDDKDDEDDGINEGVTVTY